ncbi:Disease resistance protein RPP8 [Rhynchospora pubera]|uniref:Disease resistance protein RPP8 n=1 Tax=Rhynchospora pubera TaxID=906938 RepID=A0AAV8FSJ0_9POAL|nr:Disease resistance protein RPP8 [Rhynchospora pubera]
MEAVAVKYALGKLSLLLNMGLELYNVSDEVSEMHLRLCMIEGFLKDAHSKRSTNPAVKQWASEVRNVAYRIEDAIDTFLIDIEGNRLSSKLERLVNKPSKLKKLLNEVKAIRNTLKTISDLRTDLGITNTSAGNEENDRVPFRPTRPSDFDDSEIIGFDSDKHQIISHLLDTKIKRRVVLSIIGIGGLGKTTLAQKVYKSAELERRFNCRIWLSISQKFNEKTLLREILYSVQPDLRKKEPAVKDDELTSELWRSLTGMSYFIVLDDVWSIDLWEKLKTSLPDENIASRVLITSRFLDVAKAADGGIEPYELRFLNDDESLKLLLQKAFPFREPEVQHHLTDLKDVAKILANKCGGLPLALIVLGSILSTKNRTKNAWKRVNDTLNWHDETANRCSQVLLLSYVDLPYHLKPCFLYLACFPEDYKISTKRAMRMWIAEGFVPKEGEGTINDRAQNYFDELLQRCLVQSTEKSWDGNCKQCVMHDLIRDMAIREAKEENFLTVLSKADDGCHLAFQKIRRATLQYAPPTFKDDIFLLSFTKVHRATLQYKPPTNFLICSANIRSLLLFGPYKFSNAGFRLLRVLSIEGADFRDYKIIHKGCLEGLTHLRYLGFRYCVLPQQFQFISFNSLKNLETIDFKGTSFDDNWAWYLFRDLCRPIVPNIFYSLWKVPSLRHATFSFFDCPPLPSKEDHLKNIETLKWVSLREIPKLKGNISLCKIGIMTHVSYDNIQQGWQSIKDLLKRTEHMVSLSLRVSHYRLGYVPILSEGTSDLPCHETIQSLYLFGQLASDLCVLNLHMLPTNLTKLTLLGSRIKEDPMSVLERLQCLTVLKLLEHSFMGAKLTCTEGGFPRLQTLKLDSLQNLRHWDIKEGAMPRLTHLEIGQCFQLCALPDLQKVPTLQNLILSTSLHETIEAKDHYKIKHIPSVRTKR